MEDMASWESPPVARRLVPAEDTASLGSLVARRLVDALPSVAACRPEPVLEGQPSALWAGRASSGSPVARRLVDALSSVVACRPVLVVEARPLAGTASLAACKLVPVVEGLSSAAVCGLEPEVDQLSSVAWADKAS